MSRRTVRILMLVYLTHKIASEPQFDKELRKTALTFD